jgi:YD repeat-containing protein
VTILMAGRRSDLMTMALFSLKIHTKYLRSIVWVAPGLLLASLPAWPAALQADPAPPFYDELGRVVGVVDGQGNVTVYTYDAVGNLLPIQRFTSSGGGSTGAIDIFFFSPTSGPVGTQVTIQGFGFDPLASNNQVAFNGTAATVTASSANSITTTVPANATSGSLTVTNANGTATSAQPFTVLVPPIITGVDPPNVPQGLTTRLNIEGLNLVNATTVTFTQSGLTAVILSGATDQSLPINLIVGAAVPAGSYTFSVTTPVGTAQNGTVTVTVAVPKPTFGVSKPLSVQMPIDATVPATSGPGAGTHEGAAPPTSVQMPLDTTVPATQAPTGSTEGVAPPTSVQMPVDATVPATQAPTGSTEGVAPPTSVSMP